MNLASRVYAKLKLVPTGKITTYKLLAEVVGSKAYRVVGQVLANNPYAPIVPCHRVVRSDGKIGGFMGKKMGNEIERKKVMLKKEGLEFDGDKVVDFGKRLFKF